METVQYISESGSGCGMAMIGIIGILIGIAWNGTLSDRAQRRSNERRRKERRE